MIQLYQAGLSAILPSSPGNENTIIRFNWDAPTFSKIDTLAPFFSKESNIKILNVLTEFRGFQGAREAVINMFRPNREHTNLFRIICDGHAQNGVFTTEFPLDLPLVNPVLLDYENDIINPYVSIKLEPFFSGDTFYDWHFDTRNLQPIYYGANVQLRIILIVEGAPA